MGFEDLVRIEREAQDIKWGEQNHNQLLWHLILVEEVGELAKAILEHEANPLTGKYPTQKELIHVAAVVKAMWESGKRNGWL